jgi:hypothetical protein
MPRSAIVASWMAISLTLACGVDSVPNRRDVAGDPGLDDAGEQDAGPAEADAGPADAGEPVPDAGSACWIGMPCDPDTLSSDCCGLGVCLPADGGEAPHTCQLPQGPDAGSACVRWEWDNVPQMTTCDPNPGGEPCCYGYGYIDGVSTLYPAYCSADGSCGPNP